MAPHSEVHLLRGDPLSSAREHHRGGPGGAEKESLWPNVFLKWHLRSHPPMWGHSSTRAALHFSSKDGTFDSVDRATARRRLAEARVGRLATVTADQRPHIVPCCFVLHGQTLLSAVDAKPKSTLFQQPVRLAARRPLRRGLDHLVVGTGGRSRASDPRGRCVRARLGSLWQASMRSTRPVGHRDLSSSWTSNGGAPGHNAGITYPPTSSVVRCSEWPP